MEYRETNIDLIKQVVAFYNATILKTWKHIFKKLFLKYMQIYKKIWSF